MRFKFGYDRLSRDCSQSERDGCAQIHTTISMPLPILQSHCRKGTAMRFVWGMPWIQDLRYANSEQAVKSRGKPGN